LERDPDQFADADTLDQRGQAAGRWRRFFHAGVVNRHRSLVAAHTYVYLDHLVRVHDSVEIPTRTIELKWAGYVFPNAVVRPGTTRLFDCCWLWHDSPSKAYFNAFADSTDYMTVVEGPGVFHLRFTALADRFDAQSLDLVLTLGMRLDEARLVPA